MTTNRPQQNPAPSLHTTGAPVAVTRDSGRVTVPVIIWRTTPDDPDAPERDSGLTARLAHHLVAIYTSVGDTIADLDADGNLRDAAEAAGRRYLGVTGDSELSSQLPPSVALVVMRWPRPQPAEPGHTQALLTACQASLDHDDGSTIVAVTGQPGVTYAEHENLLLPAASAAGLRHLHDIIPLTASDGRDTFTYPASEKDLAAAAGDTSADTPCHGQPTALIVFGKR